MSTTQFPPNAQDEQLVAYGQPTRQQMVEEMEAAGSAIAFAVDTFAGVADMHHITVRYAGAELQYQAVGGYPIARAYRDFQAVKQLVNEGVTILCDRTSSHAFRVRVRKWAPKGEGHARQFLYNEHTTSTSGYPVRRAAEKYLAWKAKQA